MFAESRVRGKVANAVLFVDLYGADNATAGTFDHADSRSHASSFSAGIGLPMK